MTTLYLKYRPQKISELDLKDVRDLLSKIVSYGDIPHAFLFEGPRGSGKTSAARIMAKVINCEHPSKDHEPCNVCSQCVSITKGTNIDVIELDAASHRGIDDIRLIRESVKLAPAKAKKKIYIIDEAHMLTTEASNALLKTLEEPPDHVVFILATTNPEKLIDTIKSRTVRISFKKATSAEIVRSLTSVLEKEKRKFNVSVLELISRSVDGSFRDAKKLLEELLIKEAADDLEKAQNYILNKSDFNIEDLFEDLYSRNLKDSIQLLNKAERSGISSGSVFNQITEKLKNYLFSVTGYKKDSTNKFESRDVYKLADIFISYWKKYQNDVSEYLPLYLSVIRWCGDKANKGEVKQKNYETGDIKPVKKDNDDNGVQKNGEVDSDMDQIGDNHLAENIFVKEVSDDVWKEVLIRIRSKNASTEALLRASKPINFDGRKLSLGVFYKFHKEKLESLPHRICLEDTLREIIGGEIKVECHLTEPKSYVKNEIVPKTDTDNSQLGNSQTATNVPGVILTDVTDSDIEKLADEVFGS